MQDNVEFAARLVRTRSFTGEGGDLESESERSTVGREQTNAPARQSDLEVYQNALTSLATVLGPIEGTAITMTMALFAFMPLAPGGANADPVPVQRAAILWAISIGFEQLLPEGMIAWGSQELEKYSSETTRFGNMLKSVSNVSSASTSVLCTLAF